MKFPVTNAPHWLGGLTVHAMMREVLYALAPLILAATLIFGPGVLLNIVFASACCLLLEAACLKLRNRPVATFVSDGSALVAAFLIALALPPLTPWWITAIACLFAIVFAKHIYGGLGNNPFNPAMAGYVVVLVSFPADLAYWPGPIAAPADAALALDIFLGGVSSLPAVPDALSGATPLDDVRNQLGQMRMMSEILQGEAYTQFGQSKWLWLNFAALGGGLWLLVRRIIRWHIPVALLGTMLALYTFFYILDSDTHIAPLVGMFSGGTMLAAFFVATDPVSAATSDRGKLFYAAGIGALIVAMRMWGAYPDGIGFAVLLMNVAAPMIDRFTLPRVYGHENRP